nr:homeodomain-like protein [Tanacetum cinerariifolium]
ESLENSSKVIAASNPNQKPPQDFDIHQLIEECSTEVCEEQKQNMEDTILELVKICRQKELLCIHDNEVKNVIEQLAERGNRIEKSLQNFRVIHKNSTSLNNTSQISLVHAIAPILSTKEPEYSSSMGYENPNTTSEMESDEIIKSGVEELVPILSENEVTSEDKRECDVPVCENSPVCDDHSKIFSDSNNDDVISSDDDDFEDIEYVEASLFDPEIVSLEEENVVHHEEEEVDLEDITQIQDVDLREKLLSITRLISNIESLNENPTPDCVLNSSVSIPIFKESDNYLSDNFLPKFKTFCDHSEETRSDNTTTHTDNSLPKYDSFCFEIEPDQERLINAVKNDIFDDSSNDPLLEEADLFLASDNSIPSGIENSADDSEGDIRFFEALLIDGSIPFPNNESSESEDNPSVSLPPPEPPDADFELDLMCSVSQAAVEDFSRGVVFFVYFGTGISFDPLYGDYIELNDRNEPLELRRNRVDDLEPTFKEGKVVNEPMMDIVKTRCDFIGRLDDYPSNCDFDRKIHIDCACNLKFPCMMGFENVHTNFLLILPINVMSKKFYNSIMNEKIKFNGRNELGNSVNAPVFIGNFYVNTNFIVAKDMDPYLDKIMGDVIVGEPFCKASCVEAKMFNGIITIRDGINSVTYQIGQSNPRFKHLTNEKCNNISPLLKVSEQDKMNGISHSYQKLKSFYKGVLNLGPEFIRDAKVEEWLTGGHISVHEME